MTVSAGVSADDRAPATKRSVPCSADLVLKSATFVRTIWSCSCGKSRSPSRTRSVCDHATRYVVRGAPDRRSLLSAHPSNDPDGYGGADHHAIDVRSVLGTVQGSSLRSARGCARHSGLDGACAQITSWPLRDARRCDGAKLDRSCRLTTAPSGVNLFSSSVLTAHPPREDHPARSAEGHRSQSHDRQPTS